MKSQSNNQSGRDRLLMAARDAVVSHGIRRTTAHDIAERAGVSRMTFYRHLGSVEDAVLQAVTREFERAAARIEQSAPPGTGRERLVHFAVEGLRVFAASELIASIGERDPELLVPYVTDRFGQSQQLLLQRLEALVEAGRRDGSIEAGPDVALTVLLVLQGVSLSGRILARMDRFEDVVAQVRPLLERYLVPRTAPGSGLGAAPGADLEPEGSP
ncbi:TetR/AcrR family transcriptional regulator [Citricoccus nitrophenolicus]|uniref:TetR/AcrR family transcriptional regulator n=1 Tax=Citricoccus nitrophenolicus TaxID=863575 RepID=UPI0031E9990C